MRKLAILMLLAAFVAIAFASLSHPMQDINNLVEKMKIKEGWQKAMQEIHSAIQKIEKYAHNDNSLRALQQGRAFTPSAATSCVSALSNLAIVYNSTNCGGYVNAFFTASDNTARGNAVVSYCTTCLTDANNALRAVKEMCPILNRIDPNYRAAIYYNNFICAKDGNTYCAPGLLALSTSLTSLNPQRLRASDLDPICTRCNLIAVRALTAAGLVSVQAGVSTLRVLRGICFKIKGEYCAVKVTNDFEKIAPLLEKLQQQQSPSADDMTTIMKAFCSPCLRIFFSRVFSILTIQVDTTFTTILGRLCRKKDKNTYCVVDIIQNAPLVLGAVIAGQSPCASLPGACPQGCKDIINELISKTGCCWGTIADFGGVDTNVVAQAFAACQITLPPICPSYFKATVQYVFTNIDTTWISDNTNKNKFTDAFTADFKATTTAKVNSLTVATSKKRANTVTVTAEVQSEASAGDAITETEFECYSTCALTDAVADPGAGGVNADSKTVSNVQVESSSSLISFSALVLLLLSVLFLLF